VTTERAGRYSAHIDNHCYYCGAIETDQHLFFKCNLPTNIWSVASPPIITNNIPVEEDGVQMSLPFLFTHNNITDEILCKNFFLLWYIWKARNDNRFQRRTWTSLEIQQAANAHMNTHLDALKEQEQTQSGTILLSAGGAQTPQQQIGPAGTTGPTTLSASTIVPTMAIPNATTYTQGINIAYAGTNSTSIHGNNSSTTTLNRWLEPFPRLIRGTRCYTDAST